MCLVLWGERGRQGDPGPATHSVRYSRPSLRPKQPYLPQGHRLQRDDHLHCLGNPAPLGLPDSSQLKRKFGLDGKLPETQPHHLVANRS